eukprot:SAG31_NODE_866_length_11370_cov_4.806761_5_plen_51_part_00
MLTMLSFDVAMGIDHRECIEKADLKDKLATAVESAPAEKVEERKEPQIVD